jgi:hypothetical protein
MAEQPEETAQGEEELEEEQPDRWERFGEFLGNLLVIPALLLLLGGVGYAIVDAISADRPEPADPDFLDTIIASDAVVAAIRIGVIAAAAFVVISVVALVARRQWLTGFGPIRVGQSVEELNAAYQVRTAQLYEAQQTIDELEEELDATTNLLNAVLEGDTISDPESEETG